MMQFMKGTGWCMLLLTGWLLLPQQAKAITIEMVSIPGGSFTMGSSNLDDDEGPVHTVRIGAFRMSKYEITQSQWQSVTGDNPGQFKGDDLPVETVSWDDVQAFIRKLNQQTGQHFRLPSESEWEYASKAGSTTNYPWGNAASHEYANYGKDKCCDGHVSGKDQWVNTAPVGSFQPNAFGLHDMHGNVWEWVQDCWNISYDGSPVDGSAWLSGICGSARILRGGSWGNIPRDVRSANRHRGSASYRSNDIGFRLAQDDMAPPVHNEHGH